MKILFYPIIDKSKIISVHQNCDYMLDCLAHGFAHLNENVEFYTDLPHWYKTFPNKSELYGRGFTISCLLDNNQVNIADDVQHKIKSNYYDAIIYSIHNNMHKNNDIIRLLDTNQCNSNISIICGNDESNYTPEYHRYGLYYKRECGEHNALPIGFGIPKEKISSNTEIVKDKLISSIIPAFGGPKTYTFDTEEEYYNEYRRSWFAYTQAKGGWDCMRHYEIIGNGCIPLFRHIHRCPSKSLGHLPVNLFCEIIQEFPFILDNTQLKIDIINTLITYATNELTTVRLVERLLCE
jgi:hypothetical protein